MVRSGFMNFAAVIQVTTSKTFHNSHNESFYTTRGQAEYHKLRSRFTPEYGYVSGSTARG
jgi:hypothetical protein